MDVLTREQRIALHNVYMRCPTFGKHNNNYGVTWEDAREKANLFPWCGTEQYKQQSYKAFRKTVQYGYDCIMLPWCGMWLGIEKDGYTHS